jgi:hypothetical protein
MNNETPVYVNGSYIAARFMRLSLKKWLSLAEKTSACPVR